MERERKNRLAVFEHVPPKKQSSFNKPGLRSAKRNRSPESSYEDNSQRNVKRKRKINIKETDITISCECEDCNYATNKYYDLIHHLAKHAQDSQQDLDYSCTWQNCEYIGLNINYLKIHLTHHGYHKKLMELGSSVLKILNLPECKELVDFKLPALPEFYVCEWDGCNITHWSYQIFVDHVKCHVNALPKKATKDEEIIKCGWIGCSNTYPFQYKLWEHVKCHTKEKVIACPTCGIMFSCKTKFYDHRKRQLSVDLQSYQCSQCSKLFASERLLRDHMRIHINHYKCHLCDMTCTKPSTLAKHIRYRHLPDRPFKCDICDHTSITANDLANHKETHNHEAKIECLLCDFKCRTKYTIKKHLKQHNGMFEPKYACHCCDKRFERGAMLTKHLIKVHDFHWPSGHSRFSYKQDTETGLYHLQVVRYESLEVTQEMMQGNVPYQFQSLQNCKFECVQVENKDKPFSFVLKVCEGEKNSGTITPCNNEPVKTSRTRKKMKIKPENEVLITIEETDSKGNVVKVETMESSKILYASDIKKGKYRLIN